MEDESRRAKETYPLLILGLLGRKIYNSSRNTEIIHKSKYWLLTSHTALTHDPLYYIDIDIFSQVKSKTFEANSSSPKCIRMSLEAENKLPSYFKIKRTSNKLYQYGLLHLFRYASQLQHSYTNIHYFIKGLKMVIYIYIYKIIYFFICSVFLYNKSCRSIVSPS